MTDKEVKQPQKKQEQIVSIRMPVDLVIDLGFIAGINNVTLGEEARAAIKSHIEQTSANEEWVAKARSEIEARRQLFEALRNSFSPPTDELGEEQDNIT